MLKNKFFSNLYILAILAVLVLGIILRANYDKNAINNMMSADIQKISNSMHSKLNDHIKHLVSKYTAMSIQYQNNENIQALITTKDREKLYKKIYPDYNTFHILEPNLDVMHFYDTKNITILRMHKPDFYNDDLTDARPMIKNVNQDKISRNGFSVGRNGITYRIAIPLITQKNEHIGILEYGINPIYFYEEEQDEGEDDFNVQIIVKTKSLENLRDKKVFEKLDDYSIVESTPIFKKINFNIDLEKNYQLIDLKDKTYILFNDLNLKNYKGEVLSKIIMLKDVTDIIKKHDYNLYLIYAMSFLILLAIYIIFNKYANEANRLQDRLKQLNNSLEDKVKEQVEDIKKNTILFETIFETTRSGIAIIDLNYNFILVNNAYSNITGYSKEELYQRKCTTFSDVQMNKEIDDVLNSIFTEGHYWNYEKKLTTKNGNIIDTSVNILLMPDKNSFLVYTHDITQKNIYKKERIEQENRLLLQSRMAQMGEMIAMIAHQWRQPLGAISSTSIDLNMKIEFEVFDLEQKQGRDEFQTYISNGLHEIDGLVQNLTTTIDDFRNFYKPDKKADLSSVCEPSSKAINIIRSSFAIDGIEIVENLTSNKKIELYTNEIMQVILNILKNAQDNFKEKNIKNPKISIICKDSEDGAAIDICDNGGGIPDDILPKIFDPYFSTKIEKNGTGLGLYMSKLIIEDHHNGYLEVINTDYGICFTITLKS